MNTKTDISAAYVGGTGVDKLCLGNEVVWQSTPPTPVPYDEQYFTVEANEAGTFYVRSENFNFSKNGGPWTSGVGNTAMTLSQGDKVRFKHETNSAYKGMFSGNTMSFQVYGNIESMEYGDNFSGVTSVKTNSGFSRYFQDCSGLTTAENLVLPATALTNNCYEYMFYGCSSLVSSPELPALAVVGNCYNHMFHGCTSLMVAPELPATSFTAGFCYSSMFVGCTSLTEAPILHVKNLTASGHNYRQMFSGCTYLNTVTCLLENPSTASTQSWLAGVAATGTFYKSPSATGWPRDQHGIPVGWTVQDYVDPNAPVLKIAGQSITGTSTSGYYEWGDLGQYSGTSFTIEVLGVPITADTWDYSENYIDECGESSEISHDSGTTMSVFEVNSGYIGYVYYDPDNNSVSYVSDDDNTSDDPETICRCQGGCWDGETCQGCEPADPCDDWEGAGYGSYEECTCQERGEGCESDDICENFGVLGYETWDECMCAEHGENCPEEESGE